MGWVKVVGLRSGGVGLGDGDGIGDGIGIGTGDGMGYGGKNGSAACAKASPPRQRKTKGDLIAPINRTQEDRGGYF